MQQGSQFYGQGSRRRLISQYNPCVSAAARSLKMSMIAGSIVAVALLAAAVAAVADGDGGSHGDFEFIDDDGLLRRASSLAPTPVAVYFGYSNCPDRCARIMARLATARREAGLDADSFKVLFITVDPARDTRIALRGFLNLFGSGFIGGRIPPGQLRAVAARFGVQYEDLASAGGLIGAGQGEQIHFFDSRGRLAAAVGRDAAVAELAATIAGLVP